MGTALRVSKEQRANPNGVQSSNGNGVKGFKRTACKYEPAFRV
jgi:hypothetical protein